MVLHRREEKQKQEQAVRELFPDLEDPRRLAMVSRTPPHMIMNLVRLEMMDHVMKQAKLQEAQLIEVGESENPMDEDLISEEEADKIPSEEWTRAATNSRSLVRIFIENYHTLMIGRGGEGRDDLIEIYAQGASTRSQNELNRTVLD